MSEHSDDMNDMVLLGVDRDSWMDRCHGAEARVAELTARVAVLEKAPLCADHADSWYTAREHIKTSTGCIMCDWHTVRTRLEARVGEMEAALWPFADVGQYLVDSPLSRRPEDYLWRASVSHGAQPPGINAGHVETARQALSGSPAPVREEES